jgi:DNA modification methylase
MTPRLYYEADGIRIYHGDCLMLGPSWAGADVMVTDPPYGIRHSSSYGASWQDTEINGDRDTAARDRALLVWGDRPAAVFGTWKANRPAGARAVLVWDKGPAFGMGDLSFPWKPSWEELYIMGGGWSGRRDEGVLKGFLEVSWESRGRSHPHAKPVSLLRHIIAKAPAGTILAPFMGTGPTLVAAKELGRPAVGIEIEERYCEIAAKRLSQGVLDLGVA